MSGCWRPSSFMGKLVCGSSTVSRYLPLLELGSWLLAPVTDRTTSPLVLPRHPRLQGKRGRPQIRATAAGPGPREHSPQRMAGRPEPPGDGRVLRSCRPLQPRDPRKPLRARGSAHARGARQGRGARAPGARGPQPAPRLGCSCRGRGRPRGAGPRCGSRFSWRARPL